MEALCPLSNASLSPPWAMGNCDSILCFCEFDISGIPWYLFCDWLIPLSILFSCHKWWDFLPFSRLNNISLFTVCIHIWYVHILLIHSSFNGYLGCFLVLVIVNNVVINLGMQLCLEASDLISFEYALRCGVAGSFVVLLGDYSKLKSFCTAHQQNGKAVCGMGENIWWLYIWEKVNIPNIRETPKCDSNQGTRQNKKQTIQMTSF